MKKLNKNNVLIFMLLIVIHSCVEPFEAGTKNFENTLIIEATITDELKFQEIRLSRNYRLEEEGPSYEINATVSIVDDAQNSYPFQEIDSGKYQSITKFAILPERTYQLKITTNNNEKYTSFPEKLPSANATLSVSALKEVNKDGIEGIRIYANGFDPSNTSKYYRYTYEENYKIIAPNWSPLDGFGVHYLPSVPVPPPYHEVYTRPRTQEEKVCYGTELSSQILQIDTHLFAEDRVDKYPILFLPIDEFKITHRYSIKVSQIVETKEAYSFYKTLNKFSGSDNVFSQQQQGFISGNVFSDDNSNKKAFGYFEIASVKNDRIFFNFEDFFPNEEKPPYIVGCDILKPDLDDYTQFGNPEYSPLIILLWFQDFKFVDFNDRANPPEPNNPFFIVRRECGDCTALGSNIRPDFWID